MARERSGQTLQTTALVQIYVQLIDMRGGHGGIRRTSSRSSRLILPGPDDAARARGSLSAAGSPHVALDEDMLVSPSRARTWSRSTKR
jgi:hypothetical protein